MLGHCPPPSAATMRPLGRSSCDHSGPPAMRVSSDSPSKPATTWPSCKTRRATLTKPGGSSRCCGEFATEGGDTAGRACAVANEGIAAALGGDLDGAAERFTAARRLHRDTGQWTHSVHDSLNASRLEATRGNHHAALQAALTALADAREYGMVDLIWRAEYMVASCRAPPLRYGMAKTVTGPPPSSRRLAGYAGPRKSSSCSAPAAAHPSSDSGC